jgi:hypothetical protein
MLAVALPLFEWLRDSGVSEPLRIIAVALVGALVYALVLRSAFREAWNDVTQLALKVIPRRFQFFGLGRADWRRA